MENEKSEVNNPSISTATIDNKIEETEMGLAVTSERMSTSTLPSTQNANDVVFEVKYKKSYEGEKTMPEGKVIISKESAEQFQNLGIGSIVK
jgi:hypothetical protein